MNRTSFFNRNTVERNWLLVDLDGMVLGRAASLVAGLLTGKHKPEFTQGQDCGDFVVAINASKIKVTGTKLNSKQYFRASGYPGGIKVRTLSERMSRDSAEVFRDAVKLMIPRNRLGRRLIHKLKVYAGPDHPHKAQQPKPLKNEQGTGN
ncbi:MAG: 50S ribosomal protein L13 [bacterium]|jgi:large subunit ribosomal protein L13